MATFNNGESGLSVRTKINNVLQHTDGTASELVINDAGADINFRVESDTNANALFLDGGTGNVGIGTSPAVELHVRGTSDPEVRIDNGTTSSQSRYSFTTGGTTDGYMGMTASTATLNIESGRSVGWNGKITFTTDTVERMRITQTGNVGIGTSSPSYTLDTFGAVASRGGGAGNAAFVLQEVGNNPWHLMQFTGGTFSINYNGLSTANSTLAIDASGNVGLGTTNPSYPLQINRATVSTVAVVAGASSEARLFLGDAANVAAGRIVYDNATDSLELFANDSERMRITSTGNVGIGTATPGSKLSIVGLPTSSAGLSAGDIWNDGGTLKIV